MLDEQLGIDAEDVKVMASRCVTLLAEREAMDRDVAIKQDEIKQLRRRIKEIGYLIEYAMQQIAASQLAKS